MYHHGHKFKPTKALDIIRTNTVTRACPKLPSDPHSQIRDIDMAKQNLLVVIGATGTQGGSVVDAFRGEPTWKIRGITRNVSASRAKRLSTLGVEMVEADLDDVDSLSCAFQGATVVYGVTDFWKPLSDPSLTKTRKPGQSLSRWAYEYELQQGKNIFDAAAKINTLERLIFSTIADVAEHSEGKYTRAYHADTKAHAEQYGKQQYPELWRKTSTIQVGVYLSNFAELSTEMPKKVRTSCRISQCWLTHFAGSGRLLQFCQSISRPHASSLDSRG